MAEDDSDMRNGRNKRKGNMSGPHGILMEVILIVDSGINRLLGIFFLPNTVSIIRLDTTRPGYQAWVHSSDQTKPQCVPRPGSVKTNYRYCIFCS